MSNSTSTQSLESATPIDGGFDDYTVLKTVPPSQVESPGPFAAGLHYAAADLSDLVPVAPEAKREPLMAVVRLLRTLADN